ncbi:hypothetical protein FGB62_235g010 [Gracilaria domingensis]|nr:hypothetical protein FGB62_235g010 [Gracilaria domingensis]
MVARRQGGLHQESAQFEGHRQERACLQREAVSTRHSVQGGRQEIRPQGCQAGPHRYQSEESNPHSRQDSLRSQGAGSAGASSALSGVSARSSDDFDDDFDDLAVDDIPEPEVVTTSSVRSKKAPPISRQPVPIKPPSPQPSPPAQPAPKPTPAQSPPSARAAEPAPVAAAPSMRRARPATVRQEDISAFQIAEDQSKLSDLVKENDRLSSDLQRAKTERSSLEQSHKRQIDELNAQLQLHEKKVSNVESQRSSSEAALSDLRSNNEELTTRISALTSELDSVKRSRDEYQVKSKKLSASEQKCRDLSREVDRLTIAVSQSANSPNSAKSNSEVEERLLTLRKEKEELERKVKGHEAHSLKVREAYQNLTDMYNKVRDENIKMEKKVEEQEKELRSLAKFPTVSRSTPKDGAEDLRAQLEEALQQVRDERSSKDSLQSDYDRLSQQIRVLEDRCTKTTKELEDSREETKGIYSSMEDLKSQRDAAMKRASHDGKALSAEILKNESAVQAEEEKRVLKERFEKEQSRISNRTEELENEILVLKEDIDYEKGEKVKAREERDKLREHARQLERKTSQAAKQADELHSVRRQLSTQQMRDKDQTDMITDLQGQVKELERKLDSVKERETPSSSVEDIGEVLHDLVAAKLALAQAEDDKLNLQFSLKKLRKTERMTQQRLATHASRLEVKLGQATEELERLRKEKKGGKGMDAREFNELDSDIDY